MGFNNLLFNTVSMGYSAKSGNTYPNMKMLWSVPVLATSFTPVLGGNLSFSLLLWKFVGLLYYFIVFLQF